MLRVSAVFIVYFLTSNLAVSDPILNQPGKVPKLKQGDVSNGRVNSSKQSLSIPLLLRGNLFPSYNTPFKTFRDKRLASNDPDADSDTDIATLPSLQPGKIATLRARIRSLGKGSIQKVIQEALDRFNAANGVHTETPNEHEEGDPADDADMSHGDFISMDEGVNSPETELRDTSSSPTQYKPTRTGLVSTSLSDPLEVTTPHTFSTKQNPGKDFPGNSTRGIEKQPQNRIGIASAPLQQRNLSSNMNTIIAKAQVISHVPIPPVKSSITSGMNKRLESSLGQKNPGDFRGNVQLWYARKSPSSHLQFQKKLCVSSCAKERNATLKSPLLGGLQSKLAQQERLTEARKIFTTGQGKPPVERPVKSEAFLTSLDASQNTKGKVGNALDLNSPPKQILGRGVAPDQSKTKFVHFPLSVGRYRYLNTPGSMDHSSEIRTANSSIKSNPDLKSGELTNASYQWPNHLTSIPLNGLKSAYGNGHEKGKFEQHRGKEIKSIQSIQGSMVSSSLFGDAQSSANARLPSAYSKETFGATQKLSLDDLLLVKMKEYLIQLAKNDSRVMLDLENDYLSQQIGPDERGSLHTQTNGQSSITLSFPGESVKKVVPIDNRKAYTDLQARLRNEKLLFVGRVSHMGVPIVGRLHGHISPMYQGHHSYKESEGVRHFNDAVNVQAVDSYRSEDPQMQEWPATSVPEPGQAENVNPVVPSSVVEESRGTVNREGDTLHQRNHAETSYADSNGYEGSLTQNQRSIATDIAGLQMSSNNTPFLSSTPLQGNTHANYASTLLANGHGVYDADVKFISDKSENIKNAETLIRHQGTDLAQASKQEFAKRREPVGQPVQGHDVNIAAGATYPTSYGDGGRVYDGEEKAERSNNMEEAASVVRSGSAEKNDAEGNDRSIGEDKLQSNSVEENSESPTSEERYSPNVKAYLIESDDIHKETPYYKSGLQQGQKNKDLPKPVTEFPRQGDGEESRFSKVSYSQTGGDSVTQQVGGEWQSRVIEHEGRGSDKDHSELQNKYVTTDSQENQVSNEEAVHVENDFPTHIPDSYLPQPQSGYIENLKEGSGGHEEREILSAPNKPTTSNEDYYSMDDLVKVEIQPSEAPVSSSVNVTAKRERRFLIPEIKANGDHVDMPDADAKKGRIDVKRKR